jgi:hypothetical protein
MATKIATIPFRVDRAKDLVKALGANAHYFFVGNHFPAMGNSIPDILESNQDLIVDVYENLVMGKKLANTDGNPVIRIIEWTSNTIYAMYDDSDEDLLSKDFYVRVDEGSFLHVYKCLDNNGDRVSTSMPTFAHVTGSNTAVYRTSDGYSWKYMYSFSAAQASRFQSSTYMPVVANSTVSNNAVFGSVDVIKVEGAGQKYNNYTRGTFSTAQIRVGGNSVLYELVNSVSSTVNGYYTGCMLYVATGSGAGAFSTVREYFSNTTGKYFVLEQALTPVPVNGDTFEVYPEVIVTGSGNETTTARARALVNALSTNSISRVEMLERGVGYDYGITAEVIANSVVNVPSPAELRVIYPPKFGHGYDPEVELGCHHLAISCQVSNSESNTILTSNDYRQIGILRDPVFSNVIVEVANNNGIFSVGEPVYNIKIVKIEIDATVNTTSNTLSCNTADFLNQVEEGEYLYLVSTSSQQLARVDSVAGADEIQLTANAKFACNATKVYKATITADATVYQTNGSHVSISNVVGEFLADALFVGNTSGAKAQVNTISRSGVDKFFNTFVQLYKYTGVLNSGTFQLDEQVFQGTLAEANAYVHSVVNNGGSIDIYLSHKLGDITVPGTIIGANSGAVVSLTAGYGPELVFGSGDVLYVENIASVQRTANTSENFQLIFAF